MENNALKSIKKLNELMGKPLFSDENIQKYNDKSGKSIEK